MAITNNSISASVNNPTKTTADARMFSKLAFCISRLLYCLGRLPLFGGLVGAAEVVLDPVV